MRKYGIYKLLELVKSLMANIWEKTKSFLTGNLNSGLSYLITTVNTMHFHFLYWAVAGYYCHLDAKMATFESSIIDWGIFKSRLGWHCNFITCVWCIKNWTKFKLIQQWLYYDFLGKFLFYITNFSCQFAIWNKNLPKKSLIKSQ